MAKFNKARNGYDTEEVEQYVEALEAKLRSFKEKEAAIQNAIVNAQIAADEIVLRARQEVAEMRENANKQLEDIKFSINKIRKESLDFLNDYELLLSKYLIRVESKDIKNFGTKFNQLESYINKLLEEGEANDTPFVPEKKTSAISQ